MSVRGNKVALKSAAITPELRFVCAVYEFTPGVPDEMHIKVGDIIKVLQVVDDFWLKGLKLHNGETGQFPHDFVREVVLPKHSDNETLLYALDTFYPELKDDLPFARGDIIVLERKINNEWGAGRCNTSTGMFPLNYTERLLPLTITPIQNDFPKKDVVPQKDEVPPIGSAGLGVARATMNLTAQLEEELSFCVGDKITITEVLEDGSWYKGRLGSDVGTFPASFVQLLGPLKTVESSKPENFLPPPLSRTGSKAWKEEPVPNNLTNNNCGPHNKLNKDTNVTEIKKNTPLKSTLYPGATTESTPVADNSKEVLYTVNATHKFTGNTDQELSFEKGAQISIFEEADDHWLMGKVGDKEGYVPRTYVSKAPTKNNTESQKKEIREGQAKVNADILNTRKNASYVKTTVDRLIDKQHASTKSRSFSNQQQSEGQTDTYPKKAEAVHNYQARNLFDLDMSVGDTVYVLRDVDENWVEVKNESGKKGIVPVSFLKYVQGGHDRNPDMPANSVKKPKNDENSVVWCDGASPEVYGHSESKNENNHFSQPSYPINSTMPVLHEDAVSDEAALTKVVKKVERQMAFSSPKPYIAQKPKTLLADRDRQTQPKVLQKSVSVDSFSKAEQLQHSNIGRSNSNPQYQYSMKARDARQHLKAWQLSRKLNSPADPTTPPNERSIQVVDEDDSGYEASVSMKSNFVRVSNRSASMREKRTKRRYEDNPISKDSSFIKIKSDSDLTVNDQGKQKSSSGTRETQVNKTAPTKNFSASKNLATSKTWQLDSASTTSTGSSSSYGESRVSHSAYSDMSGSEVSSVASRKSSSPRRSAPPVPQHGRDLITAPELPQSTPNYPPSPWSPPVPQRKQSLQHDGWRKTDNVQCPSPELSNSPKTTYLLPMRPAPKLPPPRESTRPRPATSSSPMSPNKKVPPMRPANPPHARLQSLYTKSLNGGEQERVRNITSKQMKEKMEKLRSDIEDYSRMKRDLENLYQGTLDGKERREISENMEFVKANLRRLQKEFHETIEGQEDHIYESIEQHMRPQVDAERTNSFERLPAPPLPPQMESPGSVRKKRREKRLLVIEELVKTEKDFLTAVTVTVEDIMNELVDRQISPTTISTLFVNIVQIKDFAGSLLKDLEEALENESSPQTDFEGATIGQVFIDNNPEMKEVYMPYCRNHDDAMKLLEKSQEDHEFMQAVNVCLDAIKNKVNVFDLGSFLIKPVQRFLKYPLLIEELIKLTEPSTVENPTDHDKLILAHKMMQSLAKDINEDKRIKDLVRKYKDPSNEGLSEKLGKISIKSLKKKSSRISQKIGRATGITTQETKDAQFDEIEKRFKTMERAAKLFVQNITAYCDKCREVLCAELVVAHAMVDMVFRPERSHPVAEYHSIAEKMSGPLYRQFHNQVQLKVLSPVSSLITSFKSPQTIIAKRLDKLIDYERSQKHSDSKEKIEAAKYDYEALNKSLLDELPKLCELGANLLSSCTAIFARVHRDFETNLLDALKPLLAKIPGLAGNEMNIPSNMETHERFHPAYAEAIHTISRLQVVPASFGAVYGSTKGSAEPQRKTRVLQGAKQPEASPTLSKKQPLEDRQGLLQKYQRQQLFIVEKNYTASQLMDISCCEGDLVAVLKQQDPMGSRERWFVNKGGVGTSTGFLPASMLRPYDPIGDEHLMSFSPPQATTPTPAASAPAPTPRQKSPTPSSRSGSSADSGSSGTKAPLSPYLFRETLKHGTLPNKQDGTQAQFTDSDILEVFGEEDEIFDETEYGELPSTGTSPKSTKQHFRAEYDFTARSDLELTVRTGNIVKLIMAHDTDGNSEWWLVTDAEGKQGYVPSNYLTKAEYL